MGPYHPVEREGKKTTIPVRKTTQNEQATQLAACSTTSGETWKDFHSRAQWALRLTDAAIYCLDQQKQLEKAMQFSKKATDNVN